MRIVIVGPGALGCLFATLLAPAMQKANNSLLLLDHNRDRALLLNSQGLLCEEDGRRQRHMVAVSADPSTIGPPDIILVTVKSHSLLDCLRFCRPLISPQTLPVFLQNGIAHLDIDQRAELPVIPAFSSSSEGATLLAPGHVRHAGRGLTHMGFLQPAHERQRQLLTELAEILQASGLAVCLSDDIQSRLWAKLFINAGINPLTALYNRTNGQILTSCAARGRLKNIVKEAEAVARACGVTISADPVQSTLAVCKSTATNISSMLQDRRCHRPTEIDAINGAVVRAGQKAGVPTPFNEEIVRQIKEMEKSWGEEGQER